MPVIGATFAMGSARLGADGRAFEGTLAQLQNGRVVVVWNDTDYGVVNYDIRFQMLSVTGAKVGGSKALLINQAGGQRDAEVAALGSGGFAIGWGNNNPADADDPYDVMFRRFDATGIAIGAKTIVTGNGLQSNVTLASDGQGGLIVGWVDTANGFARRYDVAGIATDDAVRITNGAGFDRSPVFAAEAGQFFTAWFDASSAPNEGGVFTRFLGSFPTDDLTTQGTLASATPLAANGGTPAVAFQGGNTAVVWDNAGSIIGRFNGGPETGISTGGDGSMAAVAGYADGFVVVWMQYDAPSGYSIKARAFCNSGTPIGEVIDIGDTTGEAFRAPDILSMQDGRLLVSWTDTNDRTILGKFIDLRTAPMTESLTNTANSFVGTDFAAGDQLAGRGGNDTLWGAGGNDTLTGGKGRDLIFGGSGEDTIVLGRGPDRVAGGVGADEFVLNFARGGAHRIVDFTRADQVVLDADIFGALGRSVTAAEFRRGTAAQDGNDHLIYDRGTGRLWYDANGDRAGGQKLFAILENKPGLTFADFDMI